MSKESGVNISFATVTDARLVVQARPKSPECTDRIDTIHHGLARASIHFFMGDLRPSLSYGDPLRHGECFPVGFQHPPTEVMLWLSGVRPEELQFVTYGEARQLEPPVVSEEKFIRSGPSSCAGLVPNTSYALYDRRDSFVLPDGVGLTVYSAVEARIIDRLSLIAQ